MGIFALRSRALADSEPEVSASDFDAARLGLPPRFEAVGEALASGSGSVEACAVVGAQMARDGASLDESLEALRATCQLAVGTDPSYDEVRALARGWSDATLTYLHQLACEDPMTGLASLAHVRSRLSELYRGELRTPARVRDTHALVVAELVEPAEGPVGESGQHVLRRAMRVSHLGEAARTVFAGSETIGRLGPDRIVVVVERDDRLGQRVALLRRMARTVHRGLPARVWIEGLPGTDSSAALLLDELARS
ncbi:MAG: hypothetical protein R2731_14720 [Nocardioides sp.]